MAENNVRPDRPSGRFAEQLEMMRRIAEERAKEQAAQESIIESVEPTVDVEESPVAESPIEEEPILENPVLENPVLDIPVEETPVVDNIFSRRGTMKGQVGLDNLGVEPVVDNRVQSILDDVAESPVEDEPIEEIPVLDIPVEETPIMEETEETPVVKNRFDRRGRRFKGQVGLDDIGLDAGERDMSLYRPKDREKAKQNNYLSYWGEPGSPKYNAVAAIFKQFEPVTEKDFTDNYVFVQLSIFGNDDDLSKDTSEPDEEQFDTSDLDMIDITRVDDIVLDIDFTNPDDAVTAKGWGRKRNDFKKNNKLNDYLNYSIQKQAVSVEPTNILFFNYPVDTSVLCEAISQRPDILKYAMLNRKIFRCIYENVPDEVLADALAKNGLLLEFIPGARLANAKDNMLCVTAVRQNIDAIEHVPVGKKFYGPHPIDDNLLGDEDNGKIGRVDKKHVCLDDRVIDAYLSHSKEDPTLFRTLEDEWVTPNVIASALKYNFESISTFAYDYEDSFFDRKYMPEHQPNSSTVRVTRDVISELNPAIRKIIYEECLKNPNYINDIPHEIASPKLMGDLACMGFKAAKIAFNRYPFEKQLMYFQERRDAGTLRGHDYTILDSRQLYSPDMWEVSMNPYFSKYPHLSKDVMTFKGHNLLKDQTWSYITVNRIFDESHSSLISGHGDILNGYNLYKNAEVNWATMEEKFPDIADELMYFKSFSSLISIVDSYRSSLSVEDKNVPKVENIIKGYDWVTQPTFADETASKMYADEKFELAYSLVSARGSFVGLVYSEMYKQGIPNAELENMLNKAAVNKDPKCLSLIPNPSSEVARYACDKVCENIAYTSPEVIGKDKWINGLVASCQKAPAFFEKVASSGHISDNLVRKLVDTIPETVPYMTNEQFSPDVVGVDKWQNLTIKNVSTNPAFISRLENNPGLTPNFIKDIIKEVPESVNYMTDEQKVRANVPVLPAVKETSSNAVEVEIDDRNVGADAVSADAR